MTTEETIRDFVEYLRFQHCEPPDWKENVRLMALEITNNSANDYYRDPTGDEIEDLIMRYLAARQPEFTPGSEIAELNEMDAKHPGGIFRNS